MIITKLTGALGNQLFQYAAGKQAAIAHKTDLKLDLSFFSKQTFRKYKLKELGLDEPVATFLDRINKKVLKESFEYSKLINITDNSIIEGRWLDLRYFENLRLEIPYQKVNLPNSVGMHIRRTDYLSPKHSKIYVECSIAYYKKALAHFKKPRLFIFSDDPDWATKNFRHLNPEYISDGIKSDVEEFNLMRSCDHQIIANSTYSFWAAWLNENPNKIVITPEKWFKMAKHEPTNLIPKQWIKIS